MPNLSARGLASLQGVVPMLELSPLSDWVGANMPNLSARGLASLQGVVPMLELSPLSDWACANIQGLSATGWPRYKVDAHVGAQPSERLGFCKYTKPIGHGVTSLQGECQLGAQPLSDWACANIQGLSATGWPRYKVDAHVGAQPSERLGFCKYTKPIGHGVTSLQGECQLGAQPSERLGLCKYTKPIGHGVTSLQGGCPCWSSAL